jgi:putative glycosyltransferase (TIGR04372 family)
LVDYHVNNDARRNHDIQNFIRDCKREPKPIERVAGLALSNPVGDFVLEVLFYATIAKMVGAKSTLIMYRNNRPYKNAIVGMLPNTILSRAEGNEPIYADWFDIGFSAEILHGAPAWYQNLLNFPDLVLYPSMRLNLAYLPAIQPLVINEEKHDGYRMKLLERGVRDDRWLVVFHIREPNYEFRGADPERDSDVSTYRMAAQRILDAGGQVVRIGHSNHTPMGIEGEIDLTKDPIDVQCFAISKARFNVQTDSGMSTIATGLMSPVLTVNGFCREHTANSWDYVLLQRVKLADGQTVNLNDPIVLQMGFPDCDRRIWPMVGNNNIGQQVTWPYLKNTPQEIDEAVCFMLSRTSAINGWHSPLEPDPIPVTGTFQLPIIPHVPKTQLFTPTRAATLSQVD